MDITVKGDVNMATSNHMDVKKCKEQHQFTHYKVIYIYERVCVLMSAPDSRSHSDITSIFDYTPFHIICIQPERRPILIVIIF